MIHLFDKYVGQIVERLEKSGELDNTMIVITSTAGPVQDGYGGAPTAFYQSTSRLRGYQSSLYEGGIRIPLIIDWPDGIKQSQTSTHLTAAWDLFATFEDLLEGKSRSETDGISLLPIIQNQEKVKNHDYLYWESHQGNGWQAVRKDNWKLVRSNAYFEEDRIDQLFQLDIDRAEQSDLSSRYPEVLIELQSILEKREVSEIAEWNF